MGEVGEVGEVLFASGQRTPGCECVWKREEACTAVAWSAGPQRRPCGMAQVAQTGALARIDASQRRWRLANGRRASPARARREVSEGRQMDRPIDRETTSRDRATRGIAEGRQASKQAIPHAARNHRPAQGMAAGDGVDETRRDATTVLDMRRIPGERH